MGRCMKDSRMPSEGLTDIGRCRRPDEEASFGHLVQQKSEE